MVELLLLAVPLDRPLQVGPLQVPVVVGGLPAALQVELVLRTRALQVVVVQLVALLLGVVVLGPLLADLVLVLHQQHLLDVLDLAGHSLSRGLLLRL